MSLWDENTPREGKKAEETLKAIIYNPKFQALREKFWDEIILFGQPSEATQQELENLITGKDTEIV